MKGKLIKKLLTIGLSLAMAVCVFIGCASTGGGSNEPPGILTITGIPAEYEGKFISSKMYSSLASNAKAYIGNSVVNAKYTAVADGVVKLPLYTYGFIPKGYVGNDTLYVELEISDGRIDGGFVLTMLLSRAAIASVVFENGVAEASWDNAVKAGYITVTNIPEIYSQSSKINVQVGQEAKKIPVSIGGSVAIGFETLIATGNGECSDGNLGLPALFSNGITTVPVLPSRKEAGYTSDFPKSGTMDIVVNLTPPSGNTSGVSMTATHTFLFNAVQIRDGKAILDFRRGVRQ
jgi:hypothetical protein